MTIWLIILLILHAVPGVFWAGTTFALARAPLAWPEMGMARAQAGAAGITILAGLGLWAMNHGGLPATGEWVLSIGALCAIAAAGVQHAIAWPARRKLAQLGDQQASEATRLRRRAVKGQRIASLLLVVTVITMVTWRYW
jgi:hypothetical protein